MKQIFNKTKNKDLIFSFLNSLYTNETIYNEILDNFGNNSETEKLIFEYSYELTIIASILQDLEQFFNYMGFSYNDNNNNSNTYNKEDFINFYEKRAKDEPDIVWKNIEKMKYWKNFEKMKEIKNEGKQKI